MRRIIAGTIVIGSVSYITAYWIAPAIGNLFNTDLTRDQQTLVLYGAYIVSFIGYVTFVPKGK